MSLRLYGPYMSFLVQVREAVHGLSREILTLQALGDKVAAKELLDKYGVLTPQLQRSLSQLESVQVLRAFSRWVSLSTGR